MEPHENHYVVQICTNLGADLDVRHSSSECCKILLVSVHDSMTNGEHLPLLEIELREVRALQT